MPVDDPNFPFYFYKYMVSGSDQGKRKEEWFKNNPISILGRIC